ncbi:MAG TPA: toxin-antitoxin system, antitoxin component, Xre family protein [Cyanobacteria bacterium UBA11372]|nr:toxin-antitoxin system, antitoxin component, Xre family protein [Cyanobacteria bacterium UBA11372]HBE32487.1 toxin-antitoxin system, antitoxin component, Xre family protein [Cyanobacteria bacterium UBA11368]
MATYNTLEQRILEKIRQLPQEKVIEVEDFIDFLNQRNAGRSLTLAATKLAEPALEKIWDNPEDAVYDNL